VDLVEGGRKVSEHEGQYASRWATIESIASKIGCSPEALRKWVQRAEIDSGRRNGVTTEERARVKELEREVRELRRANAADCVSSGMDASAGCAALRSRPESP
jgi:transposase-like protein